MRKGAFSLNQYPTTDISLIAVVDDDESLRESLEGLLKSLGFATAVFSSADSFLDSFVDSELAAKIACLILDVCIPGMGGPELQRELISRRINIPIIFITAQGDKDVVARVMADGAVDCLQKPFGIVSLMKAISRALPGLSLDGIGADVKP